MKRKNPTAKVKTVSISGKADKAADFEADKSPEKRKSRRRLGCLGFIAFIIFASMVSSSQRERALTATQTYEAQASGTKVYPIVKTAK